MNSVMRKWNLHLAFLLGMSLLVAWCSSTGSGSPDPDDQFGLESGCSGVVASCFQNKIVVESYNQDSVLLCLREMLEMYRFRSFVLKDPERLVDFFKIRLSFSEIHNVIRNTSIESATVCLPNVMIENQLSPNDSL